VAVQLSVLGLYLPPVPRWNWGWSTSWSCSWSGCRRWRGEWCAVCPAGARIVRVTIKSTPNNHFIVRPDGCVKFSGGRRVGSAGGYPTIRTGIVSPARIQIATDAIRSAPNDHFAAGPHCGVVESGIRCVDGACGCPAIRAGIVSAAGVQKVEAVVSAPHDHFTAGPDCCMKGSGSRRAGDAGGCPTVSAGIISSAGGVVVEPISSAPDDHFAAGPHRPVIESGSRCIGGAGSCPAIRNWDYIAHRCSKSSPRGSQLHPRRSFRYQSKRPCEGIVQRAHPWCLCPSNYWSRDRIFPQCSKGSRYTATPNDHLTAGPNRSVEVSDSRWIGSAGGSPSVIDASVRISR